MSLFQELCMTMKECEERVYAFRGKSRELSFDFAEGVRKYIDAPKEWTSVDKNRKEPYVTAIPVDKNWREIEEDRRRFDMYFNENNFYLFHLVVVLEKSPQTYPKSVYNFNCGIRPRAEGKCSLFVAYGDMTRKKGFECEKESDFSEAAKYITGILLEVLNLNPFDKNR